MNGFLGTYPSLGGSDGSLGYVILGFGAIAVSLGLIWWLLKKDRASQSTDMLGPHSNLENLDSQRPAKPRWWEAPRGVRSEKPVVVRTLPRMTAASVRRREIAQYEKNRYTLRNMARTTTGKTILTFHKTDVSSIGELPTPSPDPNIADQLEKLVELRDEGVLSPDEFERAKSKLLS